MISPGHPFFFVATLREFREATFHLSKYVYKKDSLVDDREYVEIIGASFSPEAVENLIASLTSEQELAFHSLIKIGGRAFHLPMIDFAANDLDSAEVMCRMHTFLPKSFLQNLSFYDSGRSFHAYSLKLLKPGAWTEIMGRLLLVNKPHSAEIVDSRWVGHRLIGGYASLRWSNNTKHYLKPPSHVRIWT